MQAKGLVLDQLRYRAMLRGRELELTAIEFKLPQFLVEHPGCIYERNQIMDNIYQDNRFISDRTVESHIKKLRKKIKVVDPEAELIHSVYSVGYKFEI
jgi:two-component system, OmpR family, response regulator BaeR